MVKSIISILAEFTGYLSASLAMMVGCRDDFYGNGDCGDACGGDGGGDCGDDKNHRFEHIGQLGDDGRVQGGEKRDGAEEVHLVFHLLQTWV